jgi:hypothetical protein
MRLKEALRLNLHEHRQQESFAAQYVLPYNLPRQLILALSLSHSL